MRSFLSITTKATNLFLLTPEERRDAAGLDISDTSKDTQLLAADLGIAAAICVECGIAVGAGGDPTLLKETVTETFYDVRSEVLVLSRRHNVVISSITYRGSLLDASAYMVDPEAGILQRSCDEEEGSPFGALRGSYDDHFRDDRRWHGSRIVVVYDAGFEDVPGDLKAAAFDFLQFFWQTKGRDPFVKSIQTNVPDVLAETLEYWVGEIPGQSNRGAVPDIIAGQLKRYRNCRL